MAQNINYGDTRLATLGDVRSYVSSFSEALSILAEAFSTHKTSLMTTTKLGHARLGTATNLGEGAGMVGMTGNNALAVVPASTTLPGAVKLTPAVYESMRAAVPTSAQVVDYVGNQVTLATKEIVTQSYETSTTTENLVCAWAQLAARHIQGGELVSIDLPCRGTSASIATTPIYLAVWQADANGTYVYLGHSDNAITQQIGTTGTFRFSNIHLVASRSVRLCATPNQGTAWHTATIMGGRGSSSSDGSVVFHDGRQLQGLLRCTLYYKTGEKQRFGELANENTWAATNTFNALANFTPVSADDAFKTIHIGAADSSDLGYDIWYRKSDGALMLKRGGSDVSVFSCNATGTISVGSPGNAPTNEIASIYGPLMAYNVTVSTELKANLITTSQISAKNITVDTDIKAQSISADRLTVAKNSNSQYALNVSSEGTTMHGALEVDSIIVNHSARFNSGVTVTGGTLYVDRIIATQESSFKGGINASYLTAPGGATLGYLEVASQLLANQIDAIGSLTVGTDNNQGSLKVNGNLTVTKHMDVNSATIPDLTAGAIVVSDSVEFGLSGGGPTLACGQYGSLVVDGPTYFKDIAYFEKQVNAPSVDVQNELSTKKITVPSNGSAKLDCPTTIADLTVGTDLTVNQDAIVTNDMTVGGCLSVGGNDCSGQAGITSYGDAVFTHKVTIGNPGCVGYGMSGLSVYDATDLTSLSVSGMSVFTGGATFGGGIVTDSITATGTLDLTGNVSISKGLTVTNAATFNGGIKTRSIQTLAGTSLFSVVDYKGFDISGVYRLLSYGGNTPFLVANNGSQGDGTITLDVTTAKAGTFIENGTELEDKYAQLTGTNTWSGDNKFTGMLEVGSAVITDPQVRKLDFISSDMSGIAMGGLNINNNNKLRIWYNAGIVMDAATTFNSGTTFQAGVTMSSTLNAAGKVTATAGMEVTGTTKFKSGITVSGGSSTFTTPVTVNSELTANKLSAGAIAVSGNISMAPQTGGAYLTAMQVAGQPVTAVYPGVDLRVLSDEYGKGDVLVQGCFRFVSGYNVSGTPGLIDATHINYAEHNTPSLWVDSTTAEDKQLRIGAPKTICLDCTSDDGSEASVNVGLHNSNTCFKVLGPAVYDNSQTSFYGKVYNTGDVSFSGTATFDTSPTVNGDLTVTGKITAGNADVLKVVTLTQAQYNALATKDANTLYKVQ